MMIIIDQSKKEKVKMYMKSTKKELIEMLINCNDIIENCLLMKVVVDEDLPDKKLKE